MFVIPLMYLTLWFPAVFFHSVQSFLIVFSMTITAPKSRKRRRHTHAASASAWGLAKMAKTWMFSSNPSWNDFQTPLWFPFLSPQGLSRIDSPYQQASHSHARGDLTLLQKQTVAPCSPLRPRSDLDYIKIHSQCPVFPVCHLFNFLLNQTLDSYVYTTRHLGCFCIWTMLTCCHKGHKLGLGRGLARPRLGNRPALSLSSSLNIWPFLQTLFCLVYCQRQRACNIKTLCHLKGTVKFSTNTNGDCQFQFYSVLLVFLPLGCLFAPALHNIASNKQTHTHTIDVLV